MTTQDWYDAQRWRKLWVSVFRRDIDAGRAIAPLYLSEQDALADALEGMSIDEIAAWIVQAYSEKEGMRG